MVKRLAVSAVVMVAGLVQVGHAEDLNTIFGRVKTLADQGNYAKALEELAWARKELENKNNEKLQNLLPPTLAGFSADKGKAESVMGMTNVERNYTQGDKAVRVSLTQLGGADSGLAGLAGLGQAAAMMGGMQGAVRINGRTALLEGDEEGGSPNLTIFLDGGSILKLESSNDVNGATLKKMAEELKISEIEAYIRGK